MASTNYTCENCKYETFRIDNYKRHIQSEKHKLKLNPDILKCSCCKEIKSKAEFIGKQCKDCVSEKRAEYYECECGSRINKNNKEKHEMTQGHNDYLLYGTKNIYMYHPDVYEERRRHMQRSY